MKGVLFNLENDHTSPLLHVSGQTGANPHGDFSMWVETTFFMTFRGTEKSLADEKELPRHETSTAVKVTWPNEW